MQNESKSNNSPFDISIFNESKFSIGIFIVTIIGVLLFCLESIKERKNTNERYMNLKNVMSELIIDNKNILTISPDVFSLLQKNKILTANEIEEIKLIASIKENELKENSKRIKNIDDKPLDNFEQKALSNIATIFGEMGEGYITNLEEAERIRKETMAKNSHCKLEYLDKADKLMKMQDQTVEIMLKTSTLLKRYDICLKGF